MILVTARGMTNVLGRDMIRDEVCLSKCFSVINENLLFIGIPKEDFISELIQKTGVLGVSIVDEGIANEKMLGASGKFVDKTKNLNIVDCELIEGFRIKDSESYECSVAKHLDVDNQLLIVANIEKRFPR